MRNIILLLVGLFVLVDVTDAQLLKKFSNEKEKFAEQVEDYVGKNLTNSREEVLKLFLERWSDTSFFKGYHEDIITKSNLLLTRKARPYPHFLNYFKVMMQFVENEHNKDSYNAWNKGLDNYLDNRRISFGLLGDLFERTNMLLQGNTLSESSAVRWVSTSSDFTFFYEDDEFYVDFPATELICYAKRDSIQINKTSGKYYILDNIWQGNSSLVTFERCGFSPDEVYATVPKYTIELKKSGYTADSVTFTNKTYFDYTLLGSLEDKARMIRTPSEATYPRFYSYKQDYEISDLYENVTFTGGLSMQGARLVGRGNDEIPARLLVFRRDTLILEAASNYFIFKKDRVNGINTSVNIKLDNDSIFHPDLNFTYLVQSRTLSLVRSDDFTSQGPYFNSYHKVDMNFEQLNWRIDEDEIRFTMLPGSSIGKANFESINFFNHRRFEALQLRDPVHPLYAIKKFAEYYGRNEFEVEAFANYLKKSLIQVKQLLMQMSFQGFIYYDVNTQTITVKQKLYDYLAASIARIDYDVLNIQSETNAPLDNAIYQVSNQDLIINGVPYIFLSDSQAVHIYPANEQIVLKQNRNFQFDGRVDAGLFTFYGNNFLFSYNEFKINLQNIDSLRMRYLGDDVDNFGNPLIYNVESKIENLTGEVLIDDPENKSGRKSMPEYPIFKSNENSYVYYDNPAVEGGVYDRRKFFFELESFILDSLDNFTKEGLMYNGTLYSGGIIPEMPHTLSIQPDNSLGFSYKTDSAGLLLYEGKGTFHQQLSLTNKGLRGAGEMHYLSSVTYSPDIKFYLDSVNTLADEFIVNKKPTATEYPQVASKDNDIQWLPYDDILTAQQNSARFNMFNDTTFLQGDLTLQPGGLSGTGRMDLHNSELESGRFIYASDQILADTADFFLKSVNSDGYTVLADNIRARVDYKTHKGEFNSNEDFSLIEFPENKYIGFINHFEWYMDNQNLEMQTQGVDLAALKTDSTDQLVGSQYMSILPEQDSLSFVSPLAYYDYAENLINAEYVKYLEIADTRIFPDEQKISVAENAKMLTLTNTSIEANQKTRYHTIHTATVDVYGKNDYLGSGRYDYIDETRQKQIIQFDEIMPDDKGQTIAKGEILEPEDFTLSPNYTYQGDVELAAGQKYLTFDGALMIDHNCEQVEKRWLTFRSPINPDSIYIPIPAQPLDINNAKIYNGIMVANDSIHLFSTFFGRRRNYSDEYVSTASGYLTYDKAAETYRIGSREKLDTMSLPGNYMSFHRFGCEQYGEGKLNLGVDLGQVKLETVGNVRRNLPENKTNFDIVLSADFFLAPKALDIMGETLDSLPANPVDMKRSVYRKSMVEMMGQEAYDVMQDELSLFGFLKEIPPAIRHTIVFTDLKLEWNDLSNSYHSVGPIGIGSIDDIQINKTYEGFLEVVKKRSGDLFDFYIKVDNNNWFYFGYSRGVMQTLSSSNEYIQTIKDLKVRERKMKVDRGETPYIFMLSTNRKMNMFLRRMREANAQEEEME